MREFPNQNSCNIWLVENVLGYNLRIKFFSSMRFSQNHNYNSCASLKLRKNIHQWINFFLKIQKTLFWGYFLTLGHSNLIQSFRKFLWAASEKKCFLTYWLAKVISWDNFSHKGRGPKIKKNKKRGLKLKVDYYGPRVYIHLLVM